MHFDILGEVSETETIATGRRIRDRDRLQKLYGKGNWRKMKGVADIRLGSGGEFGRLKRKRYLD